MWFITLVLSIIYIIWLTSLIRFGVNRADRIAIATETTALVVSGLYKAMPPEIRERAEQEIEQVKKQVVTASQPQQAGTLAPILKFTLAMTGVVLAVTIVATLARAEPLQSRSFYDRNGSFVGSSSSSHGNSSSFYDKSGRFSGSAIRNSDGTTSFYDKSGHFTGSSTNTTQPR
jgi:hypothetical protein